MARFASSVPTCPLREKTTDQDRFLKAEKEKFMKTKTGNIESGEICYHESCCHDSVNSKGLFIVRTRLPPRVYSLSLKSSKYKDVYRPSGVTVKRNITTSSPFYKVHLQKLINT